jgi:hypothetical protein
MLLTDIADISVKSYAIFKSYRNVIKRLMLQTVHSWFLQAEGISVSNDVKTLLGNRLEKLKVRFVSYARFFMGTGYPSVYIIRFGYSDMQFKRPVRSRNVQKGW